MTPCYTFCCLIFMTFLPGITGARLNTSPVQITIGRSRPTSQLTVRCSPDAPGITRVINIQIGKKYTTTDPDQLIIQVTTGDSSVTVEDTGLQQRMTASGSITGATGSIQFILTDLRCTDAASTYYCKTSYLAGSAGIGNDEGTANITARTYPEQIEMFPTPDRVSYDSGQMISFRCTGRIGNQFDDNNLQNLWTWEWRSIDNEFTSWTRYPNDQNITYDPPTPVSGSGGCQYNGASTLLHTVSDLDNGRQFRCSVLSGDNSDNKTVLVIGQQPRGPPSRPETSTTGDDSLGVGVAIGVGVMLVVIVICLSLTFIYRNTVAGWLLGAKKTNNTDTPVMSNIQTPATATAPVGMQTQGDEYEIPADRNHYDALQTETADIPNTYEKIRTYQNM